MFLYADFHLITCNIWVKLQVINLRLKCYHCSINGGGSYHMLQTDIIFLTSFVLQFISHILAAKKGFLEKRPLVCFVSHFKLFIVNLGNTLISISS